MLRNQRGSLCFQVRLLGGGGGMLCSESIRPSKRRPVLVEVSRAMVDAFEMHGFCGVFVPFAFASGVALEGVSFGVICKSVTW